MLAQGKLRFLRTTIAGGVLFLVPVIVIVTILEKAFVLAHKIVAPIASHLPFQSIIGVAINKVLAITLLVGVCFLAGLLARTAMARRCVEWLETSLLSNIPGYEFMKGM